jgi:hypothetical protein
VAVKRRRDELAALSLSFLDCVCCGFGGIILLLVLSKGGEPQARERVRQELEAQVARLEQEILEIRGETDVLERKLVGREQQLSNEREQIARLQGDLTRIQGEFAGSRELSEVAGIVEGRLLAAQQELTEEMKRLQAQAQARPRSPEAPVGGIPVDSEYVIFIIDTSGSMARFAWPAVVQKMKQTLEIYPTVKGVQVMNDEGAYMFSRYAGKWIPDTPARRQAILDRLRTWSAFSNSSPVEGIEAAIRTFAAPDKKISLYVLGDEFTGDSIDEVVKTVDRLNQKDAQGNRRVRIHAIGFPTIFTVSGAEEHTGVRFATLMRLLCERNGGAFVALNSTRP